MQISKICFLSISLLLICFSNGRAQETISFQISKFRVDSIHGGGCCPKKIYIESYQPEKISISLSSEELKYIEHNPKLLREFINVVCCNSVRRLSECVAKCPPYSRLYNYGVSSFQSFDSIEAASDTLSKIRNELRVELDQNLRNSDAKIKNIFTTLIDELDSGCTEITILTCDSETIRKILKTF